MKPVPNQAPKPLRPEFQSAGKAPVALFDASHGQPNWAQTGFTSREMHTNFAGVTEMLCRLGFQCRTTEGESLVQRLPRANLLVLPPPTGRYDERRQRWRPNRSSLFTSQELSATLSFLQTGGRLLAFAYRFGDSFTQTNLGDLVSLLGCRLNADAVFDAQALPSAHPLEMHFDTPRESLPAGWSAQGVTALRWRPMATFSFVPGGEVWPLVFSTGGGCLSFDRALRQISFERLPIAVAGRHGMGRFALFGGPHAFEVGSFGLLMTANNQRFLQNVLGWLLSDEPGEEFAPAGPLKNPDAGYGHELTRLECRGEGQRTIVSVERVLRRNGVLRALSRAKWMP